MLGVLKKAMETLRDDDNDDKKVDHFLLLKNLANIHICWVCLWRNYKQKHKTFNAVGNAFRIIQYLVAKKFHEMTMYNARAGPLYCSVNLRATLFSLPSCLPFNLHSIRISRISIIGGDQKNDDV